MRCVWINIIQMHADPAWRRYRYGQPREIADNPRSQAVEVQRQMSVDESGRRSPWCGRQRKTSVRAHVIAGRNVAVVNKNTGPDSFPPVVWQVQANMESSAAALLSRRCSCGCEAAGKKSPAAKVVAASAEEHDDEFRHDLNSKIVSDFDDARLYQNERHSTTPDAT